jgi:sugar lactone lactonase YvrE
MKFPSPSRAALAVTLAIAAFTTPGRAQYTNGQDASTIIGLPSFTTSAPAPVPTPTPTQSNLTNPQDVAIDNTTGKLFIADTNHHRVLRFSSAATFANGAAAEAVLGQPDFVTSVAGTDDSTMNLPAGVFVDSSGNLWVSDTGNNRVLLFQNGATIDSASPADGELGQPDFDTGTPIVSSTGMNSPWGLVVDSAGNLYVADRAANRILRFSNAANAALAAPANGGAGSSATGIFGQSNFLNSTGDVGQASLNAPSGVAVDASGNLWVSDTANNRVLRFSNAATAPNGASASLVVGQVDYLSNSAGITQSTFNLTSGLTFDTLGRLYVSDFNNNRVLVFEPTSLTTNGPLASFVLGQSDFSSSAGAPPTTQSSLTNPFGLTFTSNNYLWVADSNGARALSFALSAGTPSFVAPGKVKVRTSKKKRVFSYVFQGSNASDSYTLGASVPSDASSLAKVTFLYNGADVTSSLTAGTFVTGEFGPGQLTFTVQIKPKGKTVKTEGGKFAITLTARSKTNSSNSAQQSINIKFLKSK